MCIKKLLPLVFTIFTTALAAQNSRYYYFVYFKDKQAGTFSVKEPSAFLSERAIERRKKLNIAITEEDIPVSTPYLQSLRTIPGCEVWNISKWMNAAEVRLERQEQISLIRNLPFVISVQYLGKVNDPVITEPYRTDSSYFGTKTVSTEVKGDEDVKQYYGESFKQNSLINIAPLHRFNYKGQGVRIAVFDAGFSNAYKVPGMNIDPSQTMVRDFVTHDNSVWEDDRHGANVLGFMKVNHPGTFMGTAPLAHYTLFRTENAASEYPVEEVNWLAAAEMADSMGIDLISSSLGYNIFDDTSLSHHYRDLDGRTSIIARAANIAHSKGIIIVVSAGNEGAGKWHKIGTPSDAPGVITIGATDADGEHADFSSYGPSEDGRVKPDFVLMGKKVSVASPGGIYSGNGTSYSTPMFAGALACLLQACPNHSYDEIVNALRQSATHYISPDSAYGYGIPDMALAAAILGNFTGLDSTRDLLWNNPSGSIWEDQVLHFRSSCDQTIEIRVTGLRKHRIRSMSLKRVTLKKGEWYHDYYMQEQLRRQSLLKKRKKLTDIYLEVKSATPTGRRPVKLKS